MFDIVRLSLSYRARASLIYLPAVGSTLVARLLLQGPAHSFTSCQLLVKGCTLSLDEPLRLSLLKKSVVRITDRPDMTSAVYRGRKSKNQTKQQICILLERNRINIIKQIYTITLTCFPILKLKLLTIIVTKNGYQIFFFLHTFSCHRLNLTNVTFRYSAVPPIFLTKNFSLTMHVIKYLIALLLMFYVTFIKLFTNIDKSTILSNFNLFCCKTSCLLICQAHC